MDRNRKLSRAASLATVLFAASLLWAGDADARGKRRKGKINQKALSELMGDFKFGMSKRDVLAVLGKQIYSRYKEQIHDTNDVYAQDKLRRKRSLEIKRIKSSYIEFKGKRTGWDVSIIDDQFAHKTGESMMVHWENVDGKDQRRFFFFHRGRLYKMFIALNSGMLKNQQRNFSYFQRIMQRRYGPGKVTYKAGKEGEKEPSAVVWSTRQYIVRALDKLSFYGSFCLVISDPGSEKKLAQIRASHTKPKKSNRIIDAMVADENDEGPSLDENKGAVDSIINN